MCNEVAISRWHLIVIPLKHGKHVLDSDYQFPTAIIALIISCWCVASFPVCTFNYVNKQQIIGSNIIINKWNMTTERRCLWWSPLKAVYLNYSYGRFEALDSTWIFFSYTALQNKAASRPCGSWIVNKLVAADWDFLRSVEAINSIEHTGRYDECVFVLKSPLTYNDFIWN